MEENSRDLSPAQLATLQAAPYVSLADGEDDALSPCGLLALDIDTAQPGAPIVVRVHPALRPLLETFARTGTH